MLQKDKGMVVEMKTRRIFPCKVAPLTPYQSTYFSVFFQFQRNYRSTLNSPPVDHHGGYIFNFKFDLDTGCYSKKMSRLPFDAGS